MLRGALRVSTVDFVFAGFPDVFASFVERYPGISLTVGVTGRLEFAAYAARSLVARVGSKSRLGDFPWIHVDERSDSRWLDQ